MRYFIIAGEASGDLHASHLVTAIRKEDAEAQFQGLGGDLMAAAGALALSHYGVYGVCAGGASLASDTSCHACL